jgi:hypothetical protein
MSVALRQDKEWEVLMTFTRRSVRVAGLSLLTGTLTNTLTKADWSELKVDEGLEIEDEQETAMRLSLSVRFLDGPGRREAARGRVVRGQIARLSL